MPDVGRRRHTDEHNREACSGQHTHATAQDAQTAKYDDSERHTCLQFYDNNRDDNYNDHNNSRKYDDATI